MSAYLSLQLLLGVLWIGTLALVRLPMSRRLALGIARVGLAVALAAPLLMALLPDAPAWRPDPQVFTAVAGGGGTAITLASWSGPTLVAPAMTAPLLRGLLVLAVASGLAWAALSFAALRGALRNTAPLRRIGSVHLRAGDRSFAAWWPGRRYVVLERGLLERAGDRRLALIHELQHHRQGDPILAWVLLGLRVVSAWNPAIHGLARQLAVLEELACDEAVLARRDISPRAYGACLLRAVASPRLLPMAAGLHHPTLLHRRISMLTAPPAPRRLLAIPLAASLCFGLLGTAWAASGLVQGRSVDPVAARAAAAAASDEAFVVPEHAVIDAALDRILTRPKTAAFFAEGIASRAAYAGLVDGALADYGLPAQLAAVPLVESGYRNLGADSKGRSAAPGIPGKGVWMFIPATARAYGLQVDDAVDQRLDPVAETDAAMRLLRDLHEEFGDWGLALAGYNQGARAVRDAIEAEGTDDVWALSELGALNHYAPMVMAASMLLADPSLLDGATEPTTR